MKNLLTDKQIKDLYSNSENAINFVGEGVPTTNSDLNTFNGSNLVKDGYQNAHGLSGGLDIQDGYEVNVSNSAYIGNDGKENGLAPIGGSGPQRINVASSTIDNTYAKGDLSPKISTADSIGSWINVFGKVVDVRNKWKSGQAGTTTQSGGNTYETTVGGASGESPKTLGMPTALFWTLVAILVLVVIFVIIRMAKK